MEMTLILCSYLYLLCRRGNNHFDVHFRRIGQYSFLSKDGQDAVREGRNGHQSGTFIDVCDCLNLEDSFPRIKRGASFE